MLGDSATPVALFTIGAVLWRAQRHAHSRTPLVRVPAGGAGQAVPCTRCWCLQRRRGRRMRRAPRSRPSR